MKKLVTFTLTLGFLAIWVTSAWGGIALTVPNYSFEAPATSSFVMTIADWGDTGATGVFNNSAGFGNFITNTDGKQLAFMNCYAGGAGGSKNNIYIDLPYSLQPGTYILTVGIAARSDSAPSNPADTKMALRLFTRVPALTILAVTEVVYSDLSNTSLTNFSTTLNAEDIPATAIGSGFGIWLDTTVGSTGGDWTLDNVTLTYIPLAAHNPSPSPDEIAVGEILGETSNVKVEFGWDTGKGPDDLPNPDITAYYFYLASGEPNFIEVEPVVIPADTPPAERMLYPQTLTMDQTYYWRVDQAINGSTPEEPNTVQSPVWSFETRKSSPVIVRQPQDVLVANGATADFSIEVTSISPTAYHWYRSEDNSNETPEDDTLLTSGSNLLTLNDCQLTDEGFYYCEVTNESEIPVKSDVAYLELYRLLAWYAFENDLIDSVGENDGTPIKHDPNTPFTYTDGIAGQAIVLNGIDEAVQIPRLIQDSFSIALWLKTEATGGDNNWWTGSGLVDGDMPGLQNDFGASLSNNHFCLGIGPSMTLASISAVNDNEWHYCVATRDHVSGRINVYVDGELEATGTGPAGRLDAPDGLHIGKIKSGLNFLDGQIDEIKLYNYPVSELEIAQAYTTITGKTVCMRSIQPAVDVNNDCKVDLDDFSMMMSQWLDCALVPDCIN